jgi:Pvc16 N-terminal domain
MSDFRAIAGVTKTLAALLKKATGVDVETDKSPADTISDANPLIHLYLYRVERNAFFTNNDFLAASDTQLQGPPVGMNLFYLITPFGNGQLQIQITLGEIIQVFNDQPVIPTASLDPSIADTTEELRVMQHPLPMDQITNLWQSFPSRPYRLAMTYEASVILIDSTVKQTVTRVKERHLDLTTLR